MRRSVLAALVVTLFATASCESDILDGIIGEPDVGSMRISTGTQTVTISCSSGNVTGSPLTLGSGSTISISSTFLTPEGVPDPNVTQASFQLNVTSSGSVAFQRNNVNPFAGTLSTAGTGTSQLSFALYNLEAQSNECGPFPVTVVVN